MESEQAIAALGALAHAGRLDIFRLLVRRAPDEVPAGEIAAALGLRSSTTSNQLAELERAGLIASRRDGRVVRYRPRLDAAAELIGFLGAECCRGRPEACAPLLAQGFTQGPGMRAAARGETEDGTMKADGKFNILFLCTGNSARSVFAEAIIKEIGADRFNGFSAGSQPRGSVHPRAAALLANRGIDPSQFRSKSWDEFAGPDAPEMDFVVTVCDQAANEPCPYWPGQPMTSHWGVPDPALVEGNDAEIGLAFAEAYRVLYNRISIFISLPIESLERLSLQKKMDEIGEMRSEDFEG